MNKNQASFHDLRAFFDTDSKVVDLFHIDYTKRSELGKALKLSRAFNKTISVQIGSEKLVIRKNDKLADVFKRAKTLEAKRLSHKPTPAEIAAALRNLVQGMKQEGPYTGFMSG